MVNEIILVITYNKMAEALQSAYKLVKHLKWFNVSPVILSDIIAKN